MNINLMTYDRGTLIDVTDTAGTRYKLPKPKGWATGTAPNLFGSTVPDFPIVFRDSEASGTERFRNFKVDGVRTLHQLITAYNAWQRTTTLHINVGQSLTGKLSASQALVDYSKLVARSKKVVSRTPGGADWHDIGRFGAMNEATYNVVVVTEKDLFILALFILSVCTVTLLVIGCTKSNKSRKKKVVYKPVSVRSEDESVSLSVS